MTKDLALLAFPENYEDKFLSTEGFIDEIAKKMETLYEIQ